MALFRKPNIKKSIKAKTTGKLKREAKKAVNPLYGKKGVGFVKDPKSSIENKVYHATTIGVSDVVKGWLMKMVGLMIVLKVRINM